jgi:hypothetical protein
MNKTPLLIKAPLEGAKAQRLLILPCHVFVQASLCTGSQISGLYGGTYTGVMHVHIGDTRYHIDDEEACLSFEIAPGIALPGRRNELDPIWVRETEVAVQNAILADIGDYIHSTDDTPYFAISDHFLHWEDVFFNSAKAKFGKSVNEKAPF